MTTPRGRQRAGGDLQREDAVHAPALLHAVDAGQREQHAGGVLRAAQRHVAALWAAPPVRHVLAALRLQGPPSPLGCGARSDRSPAWVRAACAEGARMCAPRRWCLSPRTSRRPPRTTSQPACSSHAPRSRICLGRFPTGPPACRRPRRRLPRRRRRTRSMGSGAAPTGVDSMCEPASAALRRPALPCGCRTRAPPPPAYEGAALPPPPAELLSERALQLVRPQQGPDAGVPAAVPSCGQCRQRVRQAARVQRQHEDPGAGGVPPRRAPHRARPPPASPPQRTARRRTLRRVPLRVRLRLLHRGQGARLPRHRRLHRVPEGADGGVRGRREGLLGSGLLVPARALHNRAQRLLQAVRVLQEVPPPGSACFL